MSDGQFGAFAVGTIVAAVFLALIIHLIITIFFILTLQKALSRCSIENRAMEPGLTWLLLIPFFNAVWIFFVVINLAKSLDAEFKKRGLACEPEPGKTLGLAYAILQACSFIPYAGCLTGLPNLICWIMYWVKIAGYSKQLESPYQPVVQA